MNGLLGRLRGLTAGQFQHSVNRVRQWIPQWARRVLGPLTRWPPVGWVYFGHLRRLRPISTQWGFERGTPIDRYYIEHFLALHAADVRGHVLEIGTNRYTRAFGGERVTHSEVLHVAESNPEVTIIGDLTSAEHIASERFNCIILTQTLNAIFDVPSALRTCSRILKPGGVLLVTIPGISKISRYDMDRWGYFWSFTSASARRLVTEAGFPASQVEVTAHGNVLAAVAFLQGLALEELKRHELDERDPDYELLITVRAVKAETIS
jgi:SAM-dependent methyltransferase